MADGWTQQSGRALSNIHQKLNFQKIEITKFRRINVNQNSKSILNRYYIFNHVFDGQHGF